MRVDSYMNESDIQSTASRLYTYGGCNVVYVVVA